MIARILVIGLAMLLTACSGGGASVAGSGSLTSAGASASTINAIIPTSVPQVGGTTTSIPTPQGTSVAALPGSSVTNAPPVPVQFTYTLASATPSTQVTPNIGMQSHIRRVLSNAAYVGYTSTAAPISISLNVTPVGGSTSNYTGSCTAASTGTSGTCTVTGFTAAPGPTTIAGTVTESGNTIASFSNLTIIQPSTVNSINFTANPVVASVGVVLSAPYTYLNTTLNQTLPAVHAGTAYDVPVAVTAYDANGKIIAGTKSYVDSSGAPVSFILSVKNSQAGGRGTVYIKGPSRITAPGQAAIYAHYDGNWLNYSTISITSTSSAVTTSGASKTLTTVPYAKEYAVAGGVQQLTNGPDGNIWFTGYGGGSANIIGKLNPSTGASSEYLYAGLNGSNPNGIITGPDGNIWVTLNQARGILVMNTQGLLLQGTGFYGLNGTNTDTIVTGADGRLWFAEDGYSGGGNKIGYISVSGITGGYTVAGTNPAAIYLGPDGNLWVIYGNSPMLSQVTTAGVETDFTYVDAYSGNYPGALTTGADGNIWFPDEGGYYICSFNMNTHVISKYLVGNAQISFAALGSDGQVWFGAPNLSELGEVTTGGTVTLYNVATNGIPSGAKPFDIIVGRDGNMWYTDTANSSIGKFIL